MLHQPIDLINPAPQEQWWQKPRFQRFAGNALQDLGLGLASGTNISDAFGNAAQAQAQRQPARDAYEAGLQEKQARQEQITKTMEWVQKNAPQYLGDIQAGVTTAADVWAQLNAAPQQRRIIEGADGYKYYEDGSRVIPGIEAVQDSSTDQWGFPNSSAQSQKMRALTLQGIDEQTALGIVSGRYDVRTNPQTGETSIVDLTTQSIAPLSGQQAEVPAAVGNPQTGQTGANATLWEISDQATGIGSGLANTAANTLGQVPGTLGEAFRFPEQVSAKQEFELFNRELILSLSLNPRFPISEQQRIAGLVPAGVGTAPQTLKLALVALNSELSRIEADMIRSLQNPNTPVDQRQKDMQTLRGVQVAIQRIGLPNGGRGVEGGQGDDPTGLVDKYGLEQ